MTDYSTALLALAIERALTAAGPDLQAVLPAAFPLRTFVNRSVRALLVEFDSFDHCLSFADLAGTAPIPAQIEAALSTQAEASLPAHDPETGEITDDAPPTPPPAPEPEYDGPEADTPASARPAEMAAPVDDADGPHPVADVGRKRAEAFADHIEKMFIAPADMWREASRGLSDEQVPKMLREGNAILIDSAQHHHPDVFLRIKAILDRGRVS